MMNQFLSLRLAVLLLPAVAVADVTSDWSTTPLTQDTHIWNIGQSTADFPDWCIYSHGRWSSQPWHDAWVKTGPVLLPTVPFDPSNFKVACHGVPLRAVCHAQGHWSEPRARPTLSRCQRWQCPLPLSNEMRKPSPPRINVRQPHRPVMMAYIERPWRTTVKCVKGIFMGGGTRLQYEWVGAVQFK